MKMCKEDAVNGEWVEVRLKHAADCPRAEVEDQRLAAGTYHDAALSPLQARDYRTRSYYRDPHGPPFNGKRSVFSLMLTGRGSGCVFSCTLIGLMCPFISVRWAL